MSQSNKELDGFDEYSMFQVFQREYNKQIEIEDHEYPGDEDKARAYFEEEKEIRPDFENERYRLFKEMDDDHKGK